MTNNSWKNELTAEKKILDLLRVCLSFKKNKFNSVVLWMVFILMITACVAIYLSSETNEVSEVASIITSLVPHVLTYSIGILGFLVAGFAILASSNTNGLFEILAKTKHPREKVSVFQFTFFNFIFVIIVHLALLSFGFSIFILAHVLAIIDEAHFFEVSNFIRFMINSLLLTALIMLLCFALLSVKSFVWNLYANLVLATLAESASRSLNKDNKS